VNFISTENRVEIHNITKSHYLYKFCDTITYYTKSLHNVANYTIRQHYFDNKEYLNYYSIYPLLKRNNKIKYTIHCYSKFIVDYCLALDIDTIVVGNNPEWKQELSLGKRNNQNFTQIPFEMFIGQVQYKGKENGIDVIITEESYTSGTSFIDDELPKKENYDKSRRISRGLFKSNDGRIINADVNGSYQIVRKVFPNAFDELKVNGIEGVDCHPIRVTPYKQI
jgi:putative transposase